MRRILVLSFTSFFIIFLILIYNNNNNNTYAFENCDYKRINTKDISTINLEEYIKDNKYELLEFCSFDVCYKRREYSIKESINNFKIIFNKYITEEEYFELNIKGYPITRIYINSC